jgi:hypothetical protein
VATAELHRQSEQSTRTVRPCALHGDPADSQLGHLGWDGTGRSTKARFRINVAVASSKPARQQLLLARVLGNTMKMRRPSLLQLATLIWNCVNAFTIHKREGVFYSIGHRSCSHTGRNEHRLHNSYVSQTKISGYTGRRE